ncbi:hypothetical protein PoB_001429900 [Plakobranchus ocellatus]|uniref:Uncharacterized protein n=1 Tax=Plakobranchus ocellatus TaxID=259542 RepID=A0AAV3YXM6_9GAST|nr:hypothetical protein PoB_001429900 [Plakobranchus ocellatus]
MFSSSQYPFTGNAPDGHYQTSSVSPSAFFGNSVVNQNFRYEAGLLDKQNCQETLNQVPRNGQWSEVSLSSSNEAIGLDEQIEAEKSNGKFVGEDRPVFYKKDYVPTEALTSRSSNSLKEAEGGDACLAEENMLSTDNVNDVTTNEVLNKHVQNTEISVETDSGKRFLRVRDKDFNRSQDNVRDKEKCNKNAHIEQMAKGYFGRSLKKEINQGCVGDRRFDTLAIPEKRSASIETSFYTCTRQFQDSSCDNKIKRVDFATSVLDNPMKDVAYNTMKSENVCKNLHSKPIQVSDDSACCSSKFYDIHLQQGNSPQFHHRSPHRENPTSRSVTYAPEQSVCNEIYAANQTTTDSQKIKALVEREPESKARDFPETRCFEESMTQF